MPDELMTPARCSHLFMAGSRAASSYYFDGRDDNRDFPTNGVFPGNFAADPSYAAIGAAGFLGSNPWRPAAPYPSQAYFGPARDRTYCQGYRSRCRQFLTRYSKASATSLLP
jgi:hypothetical protein